MRISLLKPVRVIAILTGLFISAHFSSMSSAQMIQDVSERELKQQFISELSEYFENVYGDVEDVYIKGLFENLGPLYRSESASCVFMRNNVNEDIIRIRTGESAVTGYLLLGDKSLQLGVDYYQDNRKYFDRAEQRGVRPEVLLGILRMETWFGECAGQYNALPALFNTFKEGVKSKQWVLDEMIALILYCDIKECDPNSLQSSSRGAIGFTQFLPTNYFRYAVDGDGDGEINLYTDADAIMSTVNFLIERGGWEPSASPYMQRRAVYRYNPTYSGYVDPVFRYAEAIKVLL